MKRMRWMASFGRGLPVAGSMVSIVKGGGFEWRLMDCYFERKSIVGL